MHRLDSHINDIEPRIMSICENAPKQEEASLQQSLSSYGWILLDSWVAWRTLRFLLKETYIDEKVSDKWFQTPSSYTASQLRAVWKFTESTLTYVSTFTGKSFKELIDSTIQGKRNASAHFTKRSEVVGSDSQEIKKIFLIFSKIFLLYEFNSFLETICGKLDAKGYMEFKLSYTEGVFFPVKTFLDTIEFFSETSKFFLMCRKNEEEYVIYFEESGCSAGKKDPENIFKLLPVVNEEQSKYQFLGNKGFYRNMDLFVETVEACWNG